MAVYAVGDLQGCHAEFVALLERLRFDPSRDALWLTGDLVNRGPDSLGVLREVRALGACVTAVLGNHDLHLLAMALAPAGVQRREPGLQAVLDAPDAAELLAWLVGRPLLHRDTGLGWTLIHAGLPPQWSLAEAESAARTVETALRDDPAALLSRMYGDQPDAWSPALAGAARLRFAVNCLTRLRFVDADGRLLLSLKGPVADAPAGAMPWFRHPGRRTRQDALVFGHWSALGFLSEPGLLCLDTGCVWGGSLAAARLDRGKVEPVFLPCQGSLRPPR
ncbi:MAG TPA: symmetrical bis(5'-nucleosyl)-tetraphosphatase [Steroidobacteraceae bacterium]|nr:symmetrical bis(5'-nucleosyl)-tetraphosphatase [Steroidobacteraceae bacterium]